MRVEHEPTILEGIKFVMFKNEVIFQKDTIGILKGEDTSSKLSSQNKVKCTKEGDEKCKGA